MNLLLIKVLVLVAAIVALIAGFKGWEHHIDNIGYERGRTEVISQWNTANQKAVAVQRVQQDAWQKQKDDALNEASQREKNLRTVVARVSAERDGLRDELAASRGAIDTASVASLRKRVAALTDVFEQCSIRYSAVAEKADRHAADSLMFDHAWPKQ